MKTFIVSIFIIFNIINYASGQDWCSLCTNHIACNHPGTFAQTCPTDADLPALTVDDVKLLIEEHNKFRNQLAGGLTPGFSSASNMTKVTWDYELAYFAQLNVKQCKMNHDACRQTFQHRTAGQNLYWGAESGTWGSLSEQYKKAVEAWFNEYKDATQADITSCCGGDRFGKIGHFTQIAQDQVVSIGCSASRYTDGQLKATLIACNYSHGNIVGAPIYKTGAAGSACPFGKDTVFTNLCKSSA